MRGVLALGAVIVAVGLFGPTFGDVVPLASNDCALAGSGSLASATGQGRAGFACRFGFREDPGPGLAEAAWGSFRYTDPEAGVTICCSVLEASSDAGAGGAAVAALWGTYEPLSSPREAEEGRFMAQIVKGDADELYLELLGGSFDGYVNQGAVTVADLAVCAPDSPVQQRQANSGGRPAYHVAPAAYRP